MQRERTWPLTTALALLLGAAVAAGGCSGGDDTSDVVSQADDAAGDGDAVVDVEADSEPDAESVSDDDGGTDPEADAEDSDDPWDGGGFPPPNCCEADLSCASELRCLRRADVGDICVLPLEEVGRCWEDTDCTDPTLPLCEGVTVCPCTAESCAMDPQPGTCTDGHVAPTCCLRDDECGTGMVCSWAGDSMHYGQCVPAPAPGSCYSARQCTGPRDIRCEGATACGCGEGCEFAPGTCIADTTRLCCSEDWECGTGRCHHNACLDEDTPTGCWSDRDCGPGTYCAGETVCPCGTECIDADVAGTCQPLPTGCCQVGSDCGSGELCLGAQTDVVPGRCLPEPSGSGCWTGAQCPPSSWPDSCWYCVGGAVCPCVEACPDCGIPCPPDTLGYCMGGGCI